MCQHPTTPAASACSEPQQSWLWIQYHHIISDPKLMNFSKKKASKLEYLFSTLSFLNIWLGIFLLPEHIILAWKRKQYAYWLLVVLLQRKPIHILLGNIHTVAKERRSLPYPSTQVGQNFEAKAPSIERNKLAKLRRCVSRVSFGSKKFGPNITYWQ